MFKHIDTEYLKSGIREVYVCMNCNGVVFSKPGEKPSCTCIKNEALMKYSIKNPVIHKKIQGEN